jgi:hypothetical protein
MVAPPESLNYENDKKELQKRIQNTKRTIDRRGNWDTLASESLLISSILISALITILSFFNKGIYAAILGVVLTALLTIQRVWDFNQLSRFYKSLSAEINILETSIQFTHSENELGTQIEQYKKIEWLLGHPPKGSGLEGIQQMNEDLKSTSKIPPTG